MDEQSRLTTNIIPPAGNLKARILFVGEAPGEEEDLLGEPFVGSAGQFLRRALIQKGIDPQEVLFHNCFQQRPPQNDIGYFFKDKSHKFLTWEGQEHVEALKDWLVTLRADGYLNLVVALGAVPLQILTGRFGIYKWRGSVLPCSLVEGLKVYPTLHPSGIIRSMEEPQEGLTGERKARTQNALPLFLVDLDRIVVQSEFPDIRYPQRTFYTSLGFAELLGKIKALHKQPLVSCDIETLPGQEGEGPILWCIGFSPHPGEAFVVPFIERMYPCWTLDQEAQLHQAISEVFLDPSVRKVFQNGAYDLSVLGRYYGYRLAGGTQEDTMLCHHASYPYLYRSLHVLTSIYTDEPYYKDEGRAPLGNRGDQGEFVYNAKDCAVTREIFPVVERHAREMGTWEGYRRTMRIQPSLLGMMINGVRIDLERKKELTREFSHKVRFHAGEIERLLGRSVNLNSSVQKAKLLYGELGLSLQFHHKTKKPTSDKDALQKLKRLYKGKFVGPVPVEDLIDHMLQHSMYEKLAKNYAEMLVEPDGRVRTAYSVISTWRLNSSESHFGGGGNLQNIPKRTVEGREIRKLFIPDPCTSFPPYPWDEVRARVAKACGERIAEGLVEGRQSLLAFDLSQAEARVVAWEAEDIKRIELFEAGWDVHWYNARILFSIPESIIYNEETTKNEYVDAITNEPHTLKQLRNIGKTVVHACVDSKTSVLTRIGWMPVETAKRTAMEIMQWEPRTHKASFVAPSAWYEAISTDPMFRFKAQAFDQLVTKDHKMPYMTNGNDKASTALELCDFHSARLPVSGDYSGPVEVNPLLLRLVAAVQADGSYSGNRIRFHLKKHRKVDRLTKLLDILGYEYRLSAYENETFGISFQAYEEITLWMTKKRFSWRLLVANATALDAFLDEVSFWDGTKHGARTEYCSGDLENCEIVSTIAHLRNRQGLVRRVKRAWIVSLNQRQYARNEGGTVEPFSGKIFCPTVPSGFFFVRRNGCISVTGNSNYGMGPRMLQTILAREGFIFDFLTCRNLLTRHKGRNPLLLEWQRKIREKVQAQRFLISSYGRKREFMGRMDESLYKSAYAFSPQNTVGELLCDAIQSIWATIPNFLPLLNVHDEVVGQCNPWDLPDLIPRIRALMERPLVINNRTLTIPADASAGPSWGDLKEIHR